MNHIEEKIRDARGIYNKYEIRPLTIEDLIGFPRSKSITPVDIEATALDFYIKNQRLKKKLVRMEQKLAEMELKKAEAEKLFRVTAYDYILSKTRKRAEAAEATIEVLLAKLGGS